MVEVGRDENENESDFRAKSAGLLLQATGIISGTSSTPGQERGVARRLTARTRARDLPQVTAGFNLRLFRF